MLSDCWRRPSRDGGHGSAAGLALCLWGYHLAEATGCRLVVLSPVPIMATGDFPFLGFPASPTSETGGGLRRRLRRRLNRSSYRLVSLLKWRQDARVIQAFRRERWG